MARSTYLIPAAQATSGLTWLSEEGVEQMRRAAETLTTITDEPLQIYCGQSQSERLSTRELLRHLPETFTGDMGPTTKDPRWVYGHMQEQPGPTAYVLPETVTAIILKHFSQPLSNVTPGTVHKVEIAEDETRPRSRFGSPRDLLRRLGSL